MTSVPDHWRYPEDGSLGGGFRFHPLDLAEQALGINRPPHYRRNPAYDSETGREAMERCHQRSRRAAEVRLPSRNMLAWAEQLRQSIRDVPVS